MKTTDSTDVNVYDVVVLGGGIAGLAIARAGTHKKLRTRLIEKDRIGSATSANSLRIIHGGFRYLQNVDLPRVACSIKDQARVVREFSDLVRPLPCYLPLKRYGLKSRWPLATAALFYRFIGAVVGETPPPARVIGRDRAESAAPLLKGAVPYGAFSWSDVQLIDPNALHERIAQEIGAKGGAVSEQHEVISIQKHGELFEVCVRSVNGEEILHSRSVVDSRGQGIDLQQLSGSAGASVGWCRAFNLVYRGNPLGIFGAGMSTVDGRVLFAVGRENEIAIGTEYLPLGSSAHGAQISDDEVAAFHEKIRRTFPGFTADRDALLRVEAGILPINTRIASPEDGLIGLSRITDNGGYISVLTTKYTTFLSQADEALGLVARYV